MNARMKGLSMEMSLAKFRNDMATPVNQVTFGKGRVVLTRQSARPGPSING